MTGHTVQSDLCPKSITHVSP